MKTHLFFNALAGILLSATISSAQNAENPNPYAIFGRTPYVAGEKDTGAEAENVFVIENFAKGSKVARIEHNPKTGRVRLLNKHGKLLKEKLLKVGENGWPTQDRFAEKYYSISPYAFCAGNPMRYVDMNGDSLMISDMASLMAIFNGIKPGQNVSFKMNNGVLAPTSFADAAANAGDFFLQDLQEIASNSSMVELSTSNEFSYLDANGAMQYEMFNLPVDDNTAQFGSKAEQDMINMGLPIGRSINGNLGQTKFPGAASLSGKRSTDQNVQIVLNGLGTNNHRSVGLADEFGHTLLYMQGKPHGHNSPSANTFINKRTDLMKKRLGYDY